MRKIASLVSPNPERRVPLRTALVRRRHVLESLVDPGGTFIVPFLQRKSPDACVEASNGSDLLASFLPWSQAGRLKSPRERLLAPRARPVKHRIRFRPRESGPQWWNLDP